MEVQRLHGLTAFLSGLDNVGISWVNKPLTRRGRNPSPIHPPRRPGWKECPRGGKPGFEIRSGTDFFPVFTPLKERYGLMDLPLLRVDDTKPYTALDLGIAVTLPTRGVPVEDRQSPPFTSLQQQLLSFSKKHCLYWF